MARKFTNKEFKEWLDPHETEEVSWDAWYKDWKDSMNSVGSDWEPRDTQDYQIFYFDEAADFEDDVNQPSHYRTFPDMEAIDIIQEVLTYQEYIGYLKGNYLKYKLRAGLKNDTEKDIAKAEWYQGELFAYLEEMDDE